MAIPAVTQAELDDADKETEPAYTSMAHDTVAKIYDELDKLLTLDVDIVKEYKQQYVPTRVKQILLISALPKMS